MTLVDTARAKELYAAMGPAREISGGSAANTLAGLAALIVAAPLAADQLAMLSEEAITQAAAVLAR